MRSLGARLGRSGGALISREVGVLTHAIAFNFLLCLFPLLIVLYAVASELPSGRRAQALLVVALAEYIPFAEAEMTRALQGLAQMAGRLELLSLLLIVWGSSGIFLPVEMVLNRAWGGRAPRSFVLEQDPRLRHDPRRWAGRAALRPHHRLGAIVGKGVASRRHMVREGLGLRSHTRALLPRVSSGPRRASDGARGLAGRTVGWVCLGGGQVRSSWRSSAG